MAREISKLHEEFVTGPANELSGRFSEPHGEFTVLVPPADPAEIPVVLASDDEVTTLFGQLTDNNGSFTSKRDVARAVGERLGMTAKQVYDVLERNK